MPNLKLTYFDFDGGRGEPIRLALAIGGIPFEDDRFPLSDWPEVKKHTPLHQVPVMEIDGTTFTQTNTMCRYVGKITGLYPENALQAAYCDEAMDALEDIITKIVKTFFIEDEEEKRQARIALAEGPITLFLQRFETMLKERGGRYFADDRLTVADLRIFLWIKNLGSGLLDYIPTEIVDQVAPALNEHFERVNSDPDIVAYYESRKT